MGRVFVVQEAVINGKPMNFSDAQRFGDIRIMLDKHDQMMFAPAPHIRKIRGHLFNFGDSDYILPVGDPAAIGVACAIAAEKNNGRFKVLKYDRVNRCYYEVSIDLNKN